MIRKRLPIRDHQAEAQLFFRRAIFCLSVVIIVFVVLLGNLYRLQVTAHEEYQTRSNSNRIMVLPVPPNRGLIYDRLGRILAENIPVYSLEVIPEEVTDLEARLTEVATLLELPQITPQELYLRHGGVRRFPQISMADNLTEAQVARFSVHQHRFPGFSVEARLQRNYPFGSLFTHAIGYVGRINAQDETRLREQERYANYRATRTIGKLGIERFYEEQLHGTVGYQTVEVNNRGRVVRTLELNPPTPGNDIYLELDAGLQQVALEQLGEKRGSIVVLDANTGGVLAMVSTPSYDPNWFVGGISVEQYRSLLTNQNNPLINRATQGRYPPASTIKPLIGLLGLADNVITADYRMWDPGWFEIDGVERRFRDWRQHGHGWVNLDRAITESCNTFYYELSLELGIDRISDFMYQVGFGRRTGIDIREENTALMPTRGWKQARLNEGWFAGETLSVGIGQSYWTVTPLQLATTTQVLARRGERAVPRILRASEADDRITMNEPQFEPPILIGEPEHWDTVQQAMVNVTSTLHGTAYLAFRNASYTTAGKTGTAQVVRLSDEEDAERPETEDVEERFRDNATYIGYAPATQPEIVISIAIENVGGGGSNAAPIARKVLDYYFESMRGERGPIASFYESPAQPEELADADD
ncbi:MAG: penicillin-binding protein 2 [Idiomarinaceae bacterium HL-53]|nr:MAG: penicillin-binding protein 2 [Idiomarinaceae bacterium HL-53]CUS48755.1 penicillin-binding protein 2 [Idiomarinaceae bacterium HL-53]